MGWHKILSFVSYTLAAVAIDAAPTLHDKARQGRHIEEGFRRPMPPRRLQSYKNETRIPQYSQIISGSTSTFTALDSKSVEPFQVSTSRSHSDWTTSTQHFSHDHASLSLGTSSFPIAPHSNSISGDEFATFLLSEASTSGRQPSLAPLSTTVSSIQESISLQVTSGVTTTITPGWESSSLSGPSSSLMFEASNSTLVATSIHELTSLSSLEDVVYTPSTQSARLTSMANVQSSPSSPGSVETALTWLPALSTLLTTSTITNHGASPTATSSDATKSPDAITPSISAISTYICSTYIETRNLLSSHIHSQHNPTTSVLGSHDFLSGSSTDIVSSSSSFTLRVTPPIVTPLASSSPLAPPSDLASPSVPFRTSRSVITLRLNRSRTIIGNFTSPPRISGRPTPLQASPAVLTGSSINNFIPTSQSIVRSMSITVHTSTVAVEPRPIGLPWSKLPGSDALPTTHTSTATFLTVNQPHTPLSVVTTAKSAPSRGATIINAIDPSSGVHNASSVMVSLVSSSGPSVSIPIRSSAAANPAEVATRSPEIRSSNTPAVSLTPTVPILPTSVAPTTSGPWTNTSSPVITELIEWNTARHSSTALPVTRPDVTQSEGLNGSSGVGSYTPLIDNTTISTTNSYRVSATETATLVVTMALSSLTLSSVSPMGKASKASTSISESTESSTQPSAVSLTLPSLTQSQTAGVAVASFAGVLLAAVAAVFIARRYHMKRTAKRRSEESSVYPKVAYLYDPSIDRRDEDSGDSGAASLRMSGGATGLLTRSHTTEASHATQQHDHDHSGGSIRYSDPGNPFTDPENTLGSTTTPSSKIQCVTSGARSSLPATTAGYTGIPLRSPTTSNVQSSQSLHDHVIPTPTLSPLIQCGSLRRSHARSKSRRSVSSRYGYRPLSGAALSSSAATKFPVPFISDTHLPLPSIAPERYSCMTDPFVGPFEYDVLLPVDPRTETPESVVVYAPQQSPRLLYRNTLPTPISTWSDSTISTQTQVAMESQPLPTKETHGLVQPYSVSPTHDNRSSITSINRSASAQSPTQSTCLTSPVSPPDAPANRGWDDIKRFSRESNTISPLSPTKSFSPRPPFPHLSPSPKKRSFKQLHMNDLAIIGPRHVRSASGIGQQLSVKTSFAYKEGAAFEGPRMSLLAKVSDLGVVRGKSPLSPGPRPIYSSSSHSNETVKEMSAQQSPWAPTRRNGGDF